MMGILLIGGSSVVSCIIIETSFLVLLNLGFYTAGLTTTLGLGPTFVVFPDVFVFTFLPESVDLFRLAFLAESEDLFTSPMVLSLAGTPPFEGTMLLVLPVTLDLLVLV